MKKSEYLIKIEEYKPFIKGKGRKIAILANVKYSEYLNFNAGRLNDPEKMKNIIKACETITSAMVVLANSIEKI